MQDKSKVQLATALAATLGFALGGAVNSAEINQPVRGADNTAPGYVAAAESGETGVLLADNKKPAKEKGKGKGTSKKGKEGSCKGKEGSCKGKEGSCKGKEGSCKTSDDSTHSGTD